MGAQSSSASSSTTGKIAGARAVANASSGGYATTASGNAASSTSLSVLPCTFDANDPEAVLGNWLDCIIGMFWPRVSPAIRQVLEKEVIPNLPPSVSKYCKLKKFDLGSAGPSIKPLSVRKRKPDTVASSVIVDILLSYNATVDVVLDVGVCLLGVSSVNFKGTLTIVASELVDEVPLVGAMQFFFEQPPEIDIGFQKAASLAEIPKIKNALFNGVQEMLSQFMVLPRALPARLLPNRGIDLATLSYVEPLGMLQFQVLAGRYLCRWGPRLGELTRLPSDVKVVVQSGGLKWTSEVQSGKGDVSWSNAEGAFLVSGMQQLVQIDVFDEHYLGGPLVRHIATLRVAAKKVIDFDNGWLELEDEKSRVGAEHGTWQLEGEAAEPRALRMAVQWMPLGENLRPTQGAATEAVLDKDTVGALQVRIGQVENVKTTSPVKARCTLGKFSSKTVQSVPEEMEQDEAEEKPKEPERNVMPEDLQLVCMKLADRGWSTADIADLVEWAEEDVKFNIEATVEEEKAEVNVDGSMLEAKPAKPAKKILRHRIDDVVWLPVWNATAFVLIEILDDVSNVVAQAKVKLPRSLLGRRQALMRMDPQGYVYASFQLRLYDETLRDAETQKTPTQICETEVPESKLSQCDEQTKCELGASASASALELHQKDDPDAKSKDKEKDANDDDDTAKVENDDKAKATEKETTVMFSPAPSP